MVEVLLLCQTLTSNLCHEISGPISAIKNTLYFVNSSDQKIRNDAISLIEDASQELINKIKFYSHSYTPYHNEEQISLPNIIDLSKKLIEKNNIKLEFIFDDHNYYFKPNLSQAIMCLIINCYNHLIKGGIIQVTNLPNKSLICMRAIGKELKINDEKIKILTGSSEEFELSIFNCNEYYIKILNNKMGYNLSVNILPGMVEYYYII